MIACQAIENNDELKKNKNVIQLQGILQELMGMINNTGNAS